MRQLSQLDTLVRSSLWQMKNIEDGQKAIDSELLPSGGRAIIKQIDGQSRLPFI